MTIILSLLAIIALITAARMVITPMRRPTSMVRSHILRITPMGTSIYDVLNTINQRDEWGVVQVNLELGFDPSRPTGIWVPGPQHRPYLELSLIGEQSAFVNLGTYRTWLFWPPFIDIAVNVFWGFDADGKLIEVHVAKVGMF